MPRHPSRLGATLQVRLLQFGLICLIANASSGCWASKLCGIFVEDSVPSPDGSYIATHYADECGAIGDFRAVVNVRPRDQEFDPAKARLLDTWRGPVKVKLQWLSNESLRITVKCIRDCYLSQTTTQSQFDDVKVSYVFIDFREGW